MISTKSSKTLIKTIHNKQKLALLGLALATTAYATAADTQSPSTTENKNASSAVQWPFVNTGLKRDPELEKMLDQILARMTLQQKVAQMIQPEIGYMSVAQMRKYCFGSYLNGGHTEPYG